MLKIKFTTNFGTFEKDAEVELPRQQADYYCNMAVAYLMVEKDCGCGNCEGCDEEEIVVTTSRNKNAKKD